MKLFLASSAVATLAAAASLFGADAPAHPGGVSRTPADPLKTPEGLNGSDWSGIRGAYEKNRHAIVANPDGTYQARNPGQAWLTRFDARGFTVMPEAGGWSWGLELIDCGDVTQVLQDGGKVSYIREDGLTEWYRQRYPWLGARLDSRKAAGAIELQRADSSRSRRPRQSAPASF